MVKKKFSRNDDDEDQEYERTSIVPTGRQGFPTQELCHELLDSLFSGYEQVEHEVMATDIITIGRLREMCQAWIVPRMPDPLPMYLAELKHLGFHLCITYDGSQALFLRKRINPESVRYAQAVDSISEHKPTLHNASNSVTFGSVDSYIDNEEDVDNPTGMTSVGAVIDMMRNNQISE